MGTDDLKSMFKAAKAQRGGGGSLVSVFTNVRRVSGHVCMLNSWMAS